MKHHRKRIRRNFRLGLLFISVLAFIGFVVFAIRSERQRVETLAALESPPELRFHATLAEAITHPGEDEHQSPHPGLQPALDRIAAWKTLFLRKQQEVDGDEWDAILERWSEVDLWENLTPEEVTQIGAFLEKHQNFFIALRQTAALGGPMDVVPPPPERMDMEHLRQARDSARLLSLNALYQAHAGARDAAITDVIAGLQLGNALASEPSLMPQLVRFACTMMAYRALIEGFPPGAISRADRTHLLEQVQRDPGRVPMVIALEEMRLSSVTSLNASLDSGWADRYTKMERNLYLSRSPFMQRFGKLAYASPLARPWLNRDISALSKASGAITELAHLPYYAVLREYDQARRNVLPYTRQQSNSLMTTLGSQARHEAVLQLLQLGLTLEQYPRPPESLDTLLEHFPETTLTDPFTGHQFHYKPDGDIFLLYSVGTNLTDDGGHHDFNEGDIVWRSTW